MDLMEAIGSDRYLPRQVEIEAESIVLKTVKIHPS
jgi:hypothetical protein